MRRGGLACLQRISLARGAVEASPLAGCPASVLQRGGCSYATSSTSLLSEESSKRRPHHHSQARAEPPRRRRFDAVLLDATGTLISPSEPAAEVYRHYAALHGLDPPEERLILEGFRRAYSAPWPRNHDGMAGCTSSSPSSSAPPSASAPASLAFARRFASDGRPFWRSVVAHSLGLPHPLALPERCFEDIYQHYSRPAAWRAARGASGALEKLRRGGVRVAVCSNFDSRLPSILGGLGLGGLVDAVVVSGEHAGAEKPGPVLFEAAIRALEELGPPASDARFSPAASSSSSSPPPAAPPPPHRFGILPSSYTSPSSSSFALDRARTLVVGDDRRNDVTGGRAAGCVAWLFGSDVRSLKSLAARVLGEIDDDEEEEEETEDDEDDAA